MGVGRGWNYGLTGGVDGWKVYITIVMILLKFTKAERTGDWSLYLKSDI